MKNLRLNPDDFIVTFQNDNLNEMLRDLMGHEESWSISFEILKSASDNIKLLDKVKVSLTNGEEHVARVSSIKYCKHSLIVTAGFNLPEFTQQVNDTF